ncbi:MAG: RNA polymerase sigma factor [Candidatus Limnocylindrales bacterium]
MVDAVLGGDRDAFRALVDRESTSIVRLCHRILGDLHEAEDVTQEAFVTAFRSLASWRGDGSFGAWLARIATRIAFRQAVRRRPVAWIDPIESDSRSGGRDLSAGEREVRSRLIEQAVESRTVADPASIAVRAERTTAIRRAVARLDEPYREVVALRFFGGLSLAEIAVASDRPLGTVKTHLHRGLIRLRVALDAEGIGR